MFRTRVAMAENKKTLERSR